MPRLSSFFFAVGAAGVVGLPFGLGSLGCSEGAPSLTTSSSSGTGGQGGVFVDNGKELFAALEADLVTECSSCHVPGGIADTPFLAQPDRYASMLTWPGIVVEDPTTSLLLTYSISGAGHTGTNLDTASNDLLGRVTEWLEAEAQAIEDPVDPDQPYVEPITPILGFNALYLTPLDPTLTGIAITFTAEELTPTSLKLSELTVHTTAASGVSLVHPVFAVFPKGYAVEPDPADSFAGLDHKFPESSAEALGAGTLILTNWAPQAKLGLGFEIAEPYTTGQGAGGGGGGGGGGGTPTGGCAALTEFDQFAKPQFTQRCVSCHGGNNGGATAAVDMSDLAANSAAACAQILNRVNTTTPNSSQIFVTTDPAGNAAHPYKFGGNATDFNTFRTAVSNWIVAE